MIAVIKGGSSAERVVSLATAKSVTDSLDRQKLGYIEIDPANKNWLEELKAARVKVAIIALHGPFGEDGAIQNLLDRSGIRYTGSGADASARAFNKTESKKLARKIGLTIPRNYLFKTSDSSAVKIPVVVKPNRQGSSYGVSIVRSEDQLEPAIELAQKYDDNGDYLIEELVVGKELTCGVVDLFGAPQALPLVEIIPNSDFFDYAAKYSTESGCQEICPARIPENITEKIQQMSLKVFKEFDLRQYARIDWILRNNTPYFLEVNTLPGMTPTSLLPKELASAGISYDLFIKQLLQ